MCRRVLSPFFGLLLALTLVAPAARARQADASLRGRVADEFGAVIVGATIQVTSHDGAERVVTTDGEGVFVIPHLAPDTYKVRASMAGFKDFEVPEVKVISQGPQLSITLGVALADETVNVSPGSSAIEAENNAAALALSGKDLDVLPDDPDQLAAALLALAGPAAGPNGGQIFIDGFAGGRIPPKEAIREIRINKNPFSAEFDRLGYGRVEVLTKPGSEARLRGQAVVNFNDESLNSRNPFAPARAPYQYRLYSGSLSGPLIKDRASFFLDFQRRETDNNAVINATLLDGALNPTRFSQAVLTPERYTTFSPRLDYQLNAAHTLTLRYAFSHTGARNEGVGEFSLPSRAYDSSRTEQMFQLIETAIISPSLLNEARFQFVGGRSRLRGGDSRPTLRVLDAFVGGGSQPGDSSNATDRWEFQDSVSWFRGLHSFKVGGRWRASSIDDVSRQNFAGTYTFTSLEQYRRALARLPGGYPTQFSVSAGDPAAGVLQQDLGLFVHDDWRARSNLMLSFGLRYELQSGVGDRADFAPRVAFAWTPGAGGARQPKTVIRGGFGIFYDRVGDDLFLQAERFDGVRQQQYIVAASAPGGVEVLSLFPAQPPAAALAGFPAARVTRRLAADLRAPYTMQSALSVERLLPFKITLTTSFISTRTRHALRSRNLNAPLDGLRPFGAAAGNVFQFESSGVFNQNQLIVNANNHFNKRLSLFASYALGRADSDTDGAYSFPADPYDLRAEYGRSSLDVRHRFYVGGFISLPWEISLSPFVSASSGRPFDITTGLDANGDTLFNERPGFAADASAPGLIRTRFGTFNPNPAGATIPRNYGRGPAFFAVNLGVNRTFKFGEVPAPKDVASEKNNPLGSMLSKVGSGEKRYELTVGLRVQNLFNRTNGTTPVGNLASPLFGQSLQSVGPFGGGLTTAGNRRVDLQLRFGF